MNCLIFYNKNTAEERTMQDLASKLTQAGTDVELIDADSRRGINLLLGYDILSRPAIVVARADGSADTIWTSADQFPPISEIIYRARQ